MKDAEGQSFPPCTVGYEWNPFGTCVPIAEQPPSEIKIEQNTVCSGWSYTCGMILACGQSSMEFYLSVDDPEKYTRIIEPWFLNALNKMSDNNTWMKVKKIEVFDKATKVNLVGFKGNKEELEEYSENKNSKDYSDLIDMIVKSLVSRGFVKLADNPDEIMITQEGINKCYRMDKTA
jgi:predicted house-cleaning noncanonical NTP pyrophosphatase (MazG superfamily)